jgi:hypothetical protein
MSPPRLAMGCPLVEPLDARRLLSGYFTADYLPLVGHSSTSTGVREEAAVDGATAVLPSTFQGTPCFSEATQWSTSAVGDITTETHYETSSRKQGVKQFDEKYDYPNGNVLDIQSVQGLSEFPARLVVGQTTTFSDMPIHVILHGEHGKEAGNGTETRQVTVVGIDPVHVGYSFPHALKLVIERSRAYRIKSPTWPALIMHEVATITEWCAWGIGVVEMQSTLQITEQYVGYERTPSHDEQSFSLKSISLIDTKPDDLL